MVVAAELVVVAVEVGRGHLLVIAVVEVGIAVDFVARQQLVRLVLDDAGLRAGLVVNSAFVVGPSGPVVLG